MQIPHGYEDLFRDGVVAFLVLGTADAAGRVSVAPVWFLPDERGLVFTSEDDSIKARDVRGRPEVAAALLEEGEHARYVSVRGTVEEIDSSVEDVVGLYRRLVARYQESPLVDPAPANMAYFRLLPRRMAGHDFRDYEA